MKYSGFGHFQYALLPTQFHKIIFQTIKTLQAKDPCTTVNHKIFLKTLARLQKEVGPERIENYRNSIKTSLDPYITEAEKTQSVVKALSLANYYRNHTTDQDCQAVEWLCRAKTYQEDF